MFIAFPYRRKAQLKELFYEKGKEERSGVSALRSAGFFMLPGVVCGGICVELRRGAE